MGNNIISAGSLFNMPKTMDLRSSVNLNNNLNQNSTYRGKLETTEENEIIETTNIVPSFKIGGPIGNNLQNYFKA